ncbi:MAG: TlpA family protein disulfide reductase [Clostridia bacterium]|nr:TlpA family protein disulfide reductase [Clostridia bacterium]
MKNTLKILALVLVLATAVSLVACNNTGGDNEECLVHIDEDGNGRCDDCNDKIKSDEKQGNKVGDVCYTYDFNLLLEDGTVNIKDYRGKVVIVNFWGTWCNPCMSELPDFSKIASDMADDVVVIAVHSTNEGFNEPMAYVTDNFADSKIIFARDVKAGSSLDKYYGLLGGDGYYPYTLVIDTEGVITYSSSGGLNYDDLALLINDAKSKFCK